MKTTVRKAKSDLRSNTKRAAETTAPRSQILDITGEPISEIWQAQFAGVFCGEGYLTVASYNSVHARLGMGLRSDDLPVLKEFQRRLGGSIHIDKGRGRVNPVARWAVDNADDCNRIRKILDRGCIFEFRKRKELVPWGQILDLKLAHRGKNGGRYGPEVRAQANALVEQVRALRIWRSQ